MKILHFKMPKEFNLYLFGDQHIGAVASYRKGWHTLCSMLESSYDGLPASRNYAVDHGDCIEAIATDDVRYQAATTKEAVILEQVHNAARDRAPIKGKLLTILKGNHEAKLHRFGDLSLEICRQIWGRDEANDHYGTFTCKNVYHNWRGDKVFFRHHLTHGRKGIGSAADNIERQRANMRIQLQRHLAPVFADCLLQSKGHTHKLFYRAPSQELYMADDGEDLTQHYKPQGMGTETWIDPDSRWYCNTGSFLKSFVMGASTYSELAEYPPVELGFLIVKWRGDRIEGIDRITI